MNAPIHHQDMTACKLNSRQKCRRKTMTTLRHSSSLCTTKDFFVAPAPLFSFCKRSLLQSPLKISPISEHEHTPHFSYMAFVPPLEFVKRVISLGETEGLWGCEARCTSPLASTPNLLLPVTRQHLRACAK